MSCRLVGSDASLFGNAFYIGINLQNILYGIELVLYFETMHILLFHRTKRRKIDIFYAVFSTLMLALITFWVVSQAIFGQQMWLLNQNYPGGPAAYFKAKSPVLYMDFARLAVIILQQMAYALIIYRCRVLFRGHRVIIVPSILWLANLVLAVLVDLTCSAPDITLFSGIATELGLAYYSISVFLNVTLTCIIYYRLRCSCEQTANVYLGGNHTSLYTIVVALIVEPVLPFTLSGIAFLASYGLRSGTEIAFFCVYVSMMCVSPQILILRVAERDALQVDVNKAPISNIAFSPHGGYTSDSERSGEHRVEVIHLETLQKAGEA